MRTKISETMYVATTQAPVNIAVIKYWGKTNESLITPTNDSLSLTLSTKELCATTSIATSASFTSNRLWLNGMEESTESARVQNCLKEMQAAAAKGVGGPDSSWKVHVCSVNNFPTAAGLASSAAGYACLVSTLQSLYDLDGNFSSVARKGSGSACRSMFGGFVRWHKGAKDDGTDSVAKQVAAQAHWPEMRVIICVVNDVKKDTGSTSGMQKSVETSDLLKYRAGTIVPKRIEEMEAAIMKRDFDTFARITMQDSNQLHAICQDTYPPIRYMNQTSWDIVSLVHKINKHHQGNKLAYTFDAGPNAFLFCLANDVPEVLHLLKSAFPSDQPDYVRGLYNTGNAVTSTVTENVLKDVQPGDKESLKYILTTEIGSGPKTVSDHLLDSAGHPLK